MTPRGLATTALTLFCLGLGISAGVAQARPLCSACDAIYDNCIAQGHSATACFTRAKPCYNNCSPG